MKNTKIDANGTEIQKSRKCIYCGCKLDAQLFCDFVFGFMGTIA